MVVVGGSVVEMDRQMVGWGRYGGEDCVLLELTNSSLQLSNPFPDVVCKLLCKQPILGHIHLTVITQLFHTILKQKVAD